MKSISKEFLNEVTDRINRLRAYKELKSTDAMQDIDDSLYRLQLTCPHDFKSGVPPPKDEEDEFESSISLSEISDCSDLKELEKGIEDVKKQGKTLNTQVLGKLCKFKHWQEHYLQMSKDAKKVEPAQCKLPSPRGRSDDDDELVNKIAEIEKILYSKDEPYTCRCKLV